MPAGPPVNYVGGPGQAPPPSGPPPPEPVGQTGPSLPPAFLPPAGLPTPPAGALPGQSAPRSPAQQASPGGAAPAPAAPAAGGGTVSFRVLDELMVGPEVVARERGRTLFSSTTLGGRPVACSTCHQAAAMIIIARDYPRYNPFLGTIATLEQAQNACLVRFMRGNPMPSASRNSVALSIYLLGQ
ncbi:MAG: hypothetical protein HY815_09260 [Candidatus Riflebacteria bacterium]|nr:hypothetical protein [Candidatus Riflebacteria bacterium]